MYFYLLGGNANEKPHWGYDGTYSKYQTETAILIILSLCRAIGSMSCQYGLKWQYTASHK